MHTPAYTQQSTKQVLLSSLVLTVGRVAPISFSQLEKQEATPLNDSIASEQLLLS